MDVQQFGTRMQRRLLIVEDHPDTAGTLAVLARCCLFRTLIAASGFMGADICSWWKPDVVLIDLSLPDIDGRAMAYAIRTVLKTAKLIAIGEGGVNAFDLEQAGFDDHVLKPVTLERLKDVLP
ncbi:MAG: response regulator [Pirellulales bacterium]